MTAQSAWGMETSDAHKQAKHTRLFRHRGKSMLADTEKKKNVHTNVKARTDANTQQLSVGFQNKGINHHYTHTQTENGWAGVGVPAGLVKKTHWHLGAALPLLS